MSQLPSVKIRSSRGFTAIEMLVVVAIMSILAALALPPYLQWRRGLEAREIARDFVNILRKAKSDAINTNLEQEVLFNTVSRQYGKRQGDKPSNAAFPAMTAADWTSIKPEVTFTPSVNIEFNPNGTSTVNGLPGAAAIIVQDIGGVRTITVTVSNTGLIRMQ